MTYPTPPPFRVIGHVRATHPHPADTPIQSLRNDREQARLVLLPEFASGLDGLVDFDYAWLISWLHQAPEPAPDLHVVPFLLAHSGERIGIFATRHPARPNPIALSVVRILIVQGCEVTFSGVDLCDGTPVLDIKPWQQHLDIPAYADGPDAVAGIRGGWYERSGAADRTQMLPGQPLPDQGASAPGFSIRNPNTRGSRD